MVELNRNAKRLKVVQSNPKRHVKTVMNVLKKKYPRAQCALRHKNGLQLLISTILSAQCTDARVNMVTPALFKKYRTVHDFATARQAILEKYIKSTGFYKNKAKHIIGAAKHIEQDHKGRLPNTMEELIRLPGVARKTANIVLGHVFNKQEGIAVDTHVTRLSFRLGLTSHKDPVRIEKDLMLIVPRKQWTNFSHLLILHGRETCKAQKPSCERCLLQKECPSRRGI